jgi:trimeric autotransporter adhesin
MRKWFLHIVFGFLLCGLLPAQLWQRLPIQFSNPPNTIWADSASGLMYIGGDFIHVDGLPYNLLLTFDGNRWDTLPKRVPLSHVACFQSYQGSIYVGGSGGIAIWDGNDWSLIPADGVVGTMIVHNGKLLLGGAFERIGGDSLSSFAVWDGSAVSDPYNTKAYLHSPQLNQIYAISSFKGELYLAGNIDGHGSIDEIMRWDGQGWRDLDGGLGGGGAVFVTDMAVYGDELYVTGYFNELDGARGNNIAKWDGTHWSRVGAGVGPGQGYRLLNYQDKLYLSGSFYNIQGIRGPFLATWDGSNWCTFGGEIDNSILDMTIFEDSLYVVGGVQLMGADSVNFIAKWIGGNYTDTCVYVPVGLPEISAALDISIFPNPVQTHFSLALPQGIPSCMVRIFDLAGREVLPAFRYAAGEVDVAWLAKGVYLVEIEAQGRRQVVRLLRE